MLDASMRLPLTVGTENSEGTENRAWVGFTATKRLGGAVVRNRAKRRMRAAVREHAAAISQSGMYFVFVAREGLLKSDHSRLCDDMAYAIRRLLRESKVKYVQAKVATS